MNSINMIAPYRFHGLWVFDDPAKELVQEPFVAGSDDIIDELVRNIPRAQSGFNLIFSANPFPTSQAVFDWESASSNGNWYRNRTTGKRGWLCPALLKYFDEAPKELHVLARGI